MRNFRRRHFVFLTFLLVVTAVAIYSNFAVFFKGLVLPRGDTNDCVSSDSLHHESHQRKAKVDEQLVTIPCQINGEVSKNVGLLTIDQAKEIECKKSLFNDDVYVPFSFVKSYFDIYGDLKKTSDEQEWLSWSHSYSRVFPHLQEHKYDPGGAFLQFGGFDVEYRPRVKCVSALHGVPITTQWDKKGYYYPTQICQYALSHWSKSSDKDKETVTAYGSDVDDWTGSRTSAYVTRDACVHFDDSIHLRLDNDKKQYTLSLDLLVRDDVTLTVTLKSLETGGRYVIKYLPETSGGDFVSQRGNVIYMYFGTRPAIKEGTWVRFTRNLANDVAKGLQTHNSQATVQKLKSWSVESLHLKGVGCVSNVSLASSRHRRMFFHAADWLLKWQNTSTGGWAVQVPFNAKKAKYPGATELQPGWVSGMGQGHALSVLTRAFRATKDKKYMDAAVKGLTLFTKSSREGGFRAEFMDKHAWYEEYPTDPSSFVLNGFMYSLVGLYDVWQTWDSQEAERLFRAGMSSLKAMLPLYDTGSGTVYDLRHFTMGGPPKLARWDYHSTHVNLLYVLSTVDDDDKDNLLSHTAQRWLGYMVGKRADHN